MSANGQLSDAELSPITGGVDNGYPGAGNLASNGPAAAWNAFAVRAHGATGSWPGTNGGDSAYRSYQRQVYWRNYWCGQGNCSNAAVPGTSNHGLGRATDTPSYTWTLMRSYGGSYGWGPCSDAPWESWHRSWCGGYSGSDPGPYGAGGGGGGHIDRTPTLKRGDHRPAVGRAQKGLRRWNIGLTRPRVDNDFGPSTYHAVVQFQIVHNLKPDGVIGNQTWSKLKLVDHFLNDERWHLNRIRFYKWRRDHGGITKENRQDMDKWRKWCGHRAGRIWKLASKGSWSKAHRSERFKQLKAASGRS